MREQTGSRSRLPKDLDLSLHKPYARASGQPQGKPAWQPHEYSRNGTAKILTLFHPSEGQVRVTGVTCCTHQLLHGWLKQALRALLQTLPAPATDPIPDALLARALWERWQEGLRVQPTLADAAPPGQPGRTHRNYSGIAPRH